MALVISIVFFAALKPRSCTGPTGRRSGCRAPFVIILLAAVRGFTPENTIQINNAIDVERAESIQLTRADARVALGLDPDAYILGCIGRLVPVKGHVFLVEAFSRIQSDYPDVHVAIIGEGRSRQLLEDAIEQHGVKGRVHLLGARDDALQYVRGFNGFVMPSTTEGLPLALLEGMSGHLPVLGSDIDSLRPILEDCGGQMFESEQRRVSDRRAFTSSSNDRKRAYRQG